MDFLDADLTFYEDRIEVTETGDQVMMGWEEPIMRRMAEIATMRFGDVLEIGFGMGISCNAVAKRKPKSHTIVEAHPQIIERAQAWADGRPNTRIVAGDWQDVLDTLDTYDGISFDIYGGDNQRTAFLKALPTLLRKHGVATLWLADDQNLSGTLQGLLADLGFAYRMTRVTAIPDARCTYSRTNEFYLPIITRTPRL